MFRSKVKVKLLVLILGAVYSISYDPLFLIDIKKVKLRIQVKLSTAKHRNSASQKITVSFAIKPAR